MARLPDVNAMGARPTPEGVRPIAAYQGGIAESAAAKSAQQAAQGGAEMVQMGERVMAAHQIAQSRDDAVAAAGAETAFQSSVTSEYQRIQTEADIADKDTVMGFGQFMTNQMSDTLGKYSGSENGRKMLAARLEGLKGTYARTAGTASADAGQKRSGTMLSNDINGYVAEAGADPTKIPELFRSFDQRLAVYAPGLAPDSEMTLTTTARRQMIMAGVNSYLDRGDDLAARAMLNDNPGAIKLLSPEQQTQINRTFATLESNRNKGAQEAQQKLALFVGINGRQPNAEERLDLSGVTANTPQSPVGKALADIETFKRQYGANSPQVAALQTALTKDLKSNDSNNLGAESTFRSQYTTESKPFVVVRDAFGRIAASAESATAAGDLSLIYNFARMLDPNGAVREQDFQQIAATGGMGAQIQGYMAQIAGQGRLAPAVRADLLNQSKSLMQSSLKTQLSLEGQYKKIAARSGYNQDNVLDLIGDYRNAIDTKAPPAPKVGDIYNERYKYKGGDITQPESWEDISQPKTGSL